MNALIRITTGEQGSSVVSARELYNFLGFDSSQWARWSKKNIVTNPFARQGEDWEQLDIMSKTSEVGRPTVDYALTLDFAKRLSMLARTEKGEEIRNWFIEQEKKLNQLPPPAPTTLTTEQLLLKLLTTQQEQLNQVVAESRQLWAEVQQLQSMARPLPSGQLQIPGTTTPAKSSTATPLRQRVSQKVSQYCAMYGAEPSETYNHLYRRLNDVYGINVHRLRRSNGEYILDALGRYGYLDKLYCLIEAELAYKE